MGELIEVVLPDGTTVWARVSAAGELAEGPDDDRPSPSGAGRRAVAKVGHLVETIRGVAASVRKATEGLGPDEVEVRFGLELSAAPGRLVAVLADGEARSTLEVALTWKGEETKNAPAAGGTSQDGPEGGA